VTDVLPSGIVTILASNVTLLAGQSVDYAKSYTISQADMDINGEPAGSGNITNTAIATDTRGDNVSSSASTPITFTPGIDIEKLVSVDGGVNWYFTAAGYGPNATISQISAETGISSAKLHIGTPTAVDGTQVQFKVVITNTGDVTDHNVTVADVGDSAALNANFTFGGSATVSTLAVGQSIVSDVIKTTAVNGSHTDVATVSGTYGSGAAVGNLPHASDTETYTGVFQTGGPCHVSSWWCGNHYTYSNGSCGSTNSSGSSNNWNECTYNGQKGILLGDYSGTAWCGSGTASNPKSLTSIPTGMIFITDSVASDILGANITSSSDTRLQITAAAISAQLNIDNGVADAGTAGHDLVGEAVAWLTGKGPFTYGDGSSGNIDSNHNGVIDSSDYNSSSNTFSGTSQSTSKLDWTAYVDPINATAKTGDLQVSGKDLLAALNAFNANGLQLVTSMAGDLVAWQNSSGAIDVHQNTADAFWTVLKDQGVIAGSLHS
jgi:hypothetical protein